MAFSQSIGKAQTMAVCQFCEESTEIKWKCINCELFLCQRCCSKIHSKSKASMQHGIINLKDTETEDFAKIMREVDLQHMQCKIHGKQMCFIYCKDCSEPACSKCMIEAHQKHEYKALGEVYEIIMADMNELENHLQSNLQLFRKKKDELKKMLSDGEINFQETRKLILQTEEEIKEMISKNTKNLLFKLEIKWKSVEIRFNAELSALKKNEGDLEIRKNKLDQVLQSHQVADIFSASKTLDKSSHEFLFQKIKHNKTLFLPSNLHMNIGSKMLGDLYTVPTFKIIDTYQSNVGNVTNLVLSTDHTAFMGSYNSKKLQILKYKNNNIIVEKEIQIAANDMALTIDGDLLVSCGESNLKTFTKDGQFKLVKGFFTLKTLGVHVSKNNEIIVGLIERFPVTFPLPKDCIRKLVVMKENGFIQHTIKHDRNNQNLLTYPYRINTLNDKILVVDIINKEWEGRIVMVDFWGQLNWIYSGCKSKSKNVKFYPTDVVITSTDTIFVSDNGNHAIHVLNPAGEIIIHKDIQSLGIELPWSLNIDQNEVLWIGCSMWEDDATNKAKIRCIELT